MSYKKHTRPNHAHGYWEKYRQNGQLQYKGNWFNGERHGYFEWGTGMKEFYLI